MNKNLKNLFAACVLTPPNTFKSFVEFISCNINKSIIPFIMALSFAVFFWGIVQYLLGANEETKRTKGREFMIWGIVGLAVMISIWGFVAVLGNTFGVQNVIPQVQNTSI
ncbi:MAG: hypothetical protein NTW62_01855 [Candidatus Nomurabacteria bacterium]|nr:hypothetical protein [Candidatus Nomurabacteria bacterium]